MSRRVCATRAGWCAVSATLFVLVSCTTTAFVVMKNLPWSIFLVDTPLGFKLLERLYTAPLVNFRHTIDIVLSVYDEPPQVLLSHLETCCPKDTCRVFIYTSFAESARRSHSHERQQRGAYTKDEWSAVVTNFTKDVDVVNNEWTGAEATGYMKHIVEHYQDLAEVLVFAHGHVKSRHSRELCTAIRRGLGRLRDDVDLPIFVNINNWHQRRCVSRTRVRGQYATKELRDALYAAWHTLVSGDSVAEPARFTWECCAQFVTTRASIRQRSHKAWSHMFDVMSQGTYGDGLVAGFLWEYLWPTLIDEYGNVGKATC